MQSSGIRGHYVAATSGVPLPPRPRKNAKTAAAGWVACGRCELRTRPGAFHVCIDLTEPVVEVVKPEPKPRAPRPSVPRPAPKPPVTVKQMGNGKTARFCACGNQLDGKAKYRCRACFTKKPECGTVEGYRWHRRRGAQDPANHPWPLPKEDTCGCRAAQAEWSRLRREGEAA